MAESEPNEPRRPIHPDPTPLKSVRDRLATNPQRIIPFLILAAVTLSLSVVFFILVKSYLLALFGAAIMALVADPLFEWLRPRMGGWRHAAAGVITLSFAILIVLPLVAGVFFVIQEMDHGVEFAKGFIHDFSPKVEGWLQQIDERFHIPEQDLKDRAEDVGKQIAGVALRFTRDFVGEVLHISIQLLVFLVAFYFFLADGRGILSTWERMTPLDVAHDRFIRDQFAVVCRGAMWGTVLAAIGQGLAITVGLAIAEFFLDANMGRWVLLLGVLTCVMAIIPVLGAAGVWVPTALVLLTQGHIFAGVFVALYGLVVVSMVDNVIKWTVIQGAADLHPLLVLICAFGGLQVMGILGIFLGPAVGAIVFALLKVVREELNVMATSDTQEGQAGT